MLVEALRLPGEEATGRKTTTVIISRVAGGFVAEAKETTGLEEPPYPWTAKIVNGEFVYRSRADDVPAATQMSPDDLFALQINNSFARRARLQRLAISELV